jgi:hypothetical protein
MPKRKLIGCGLPASTLKQFIDLSYETNSTQAPAGYTIDKSLSDSRVKVYTSNKNSNVIVVHRGSAALSDWIDNALYATTGNVKSSGTYKQHKKKQDAAIAKYGANNIISIGHSRGAKYAEELNKDNPVKEVITYNKAAGLHDVRQKNPSNQTDVKTSRDIVSLLTPLQQSSNNVVTIKQDTLNPHTAHMTSALDTLGEQNLGLEGAGFSLSKLLFGPGFEWTGPAYNVPKSFRHLSGGAVKPSSLETMIKQIDDDIKSLNKEIKTTHAEWSDLYYGQFMKLRDTVEQIYQTYQNDVDENDADAVEAITQRWIKYNDKLVAMETHMSALQRKIKELKKKVKTKEEKKLIYVEKLKEANKPPLRLTYNENLSGSGYGGGPKPKAKPTIPPPLDLDLLRSDAFSRDQTQVGESSDAGMDYGFNYEIPLSTSRGDFTSRGREKKPSVLTVSTPRAKVKGIAVKPTDTPSGLEIANFIDSQFIIADDGTGAVYDKDDNSPLGYWNPVFHIIQEAPLVPSITPEVGLLSSGKLDYWIEQIKEQGELSDEQISKIIFGPLRRLEKSSNPFLKYVKATLDANMDKISRESNEYLNNINTTYWAQHPKVREGLLKAKKVYALNPEKTIEDENIKLLTQFYGTAFNYLNKAVANKDDFFSTPIDEDTIEINDPNDDLGTPFGIIPQEFIDDSLERALIDLFTIAEPKFTIGGKPNHIFLSGIPLYKDIFIPMAVADKDPDDYNWSGKHPTKLYWDGGAFDPTRETTLKELVLYLIYNYWRNLNDLTRNQYEEKAGRRINPEDYEEEGEEEEGEEEEEEESEDPNEELFRRYATATPPEGSGIPQSQNFRQQYIKDYKQRKVGGFFDAMSMASLLGPHLLNYMT